MQFDSSKKMIRDQGFGARGSSGLLPDTLKDYLAPIVAFLFLTAFAIFIIYLLRLTNEHEIQWTRAIYLFNGVETIAFAAAGFFFGSEIQRKRADRAEKQIQEIEKVLAYAQKEIIKEVTKGKFLHDALQSKLQERINADERANNHETAEKNISYADLREIANLASRLFSENQLS